ncbi:hypothetical protein niasHT_023847 [Heterodera trifolii]|uniref:Thioredoxin domain-containing protein n=1 Tax=Heterodera trifolii TaxID=157864 RepID=A0ABD2JCI8_9BILA
MAILHPKNKEELDQIISNARERLVVIDFFATWCGPCRQMGPKFNKLAAEYPEPIYIGIDVDEHESVAAFYNINQTIEGNNYESLRKTVENNK